MFSSDGEYVEFGHSVMLEGPVESWLCDVERSMRWTLKELLKLCRTALKKVGTKREKWVKEWAGQVCFNHLIGGKMSGERDENFEGVTKFFPDGRKCL